MRTVTPRGSKSGEGPREQRTLEFKDNAYLSALAGGHARHFVRLEQKLGVKISTRGNFVAIDGAPAALAMAEHTLKTLYARLERGEEIAPADIDAELAFAAEAPRDARTGSSPVLKSAANKLTRMRTAAQASYVDLMRTNELVFGIGPAGTGKTYLAAAYGAHLLYEHKVERLILARPALEAGERLGFLPGDLREKIDPYLRPLYDALFEVMGDKCTKLMETGIIEVAPLAFMRGRTLSHAFVILDEAQNCTSAQMKMCLTRLGEESRMVVTGDPSQSDLPNGAEGLNEAVRYLTGVESVAVQRFSDADVVRHALVGRIVSAYSAHEGKAAPVRGRVRPERQ